jgi:hypothetical protein
LKRTHGFSLEKSLKIKILLENRMIPNLGQINLERRAKDLFCMIRDFHRGLGRKNRHNTILMLGNHLFTEPKEVRVRPETEKVAGLQLRKACLMNITKNKK